MGFFSFFFPPLFSAGFSFDLNWEKLLVHSDLLHGTLTAIGCAEELSTVSLAAVKVGISLSLDLPSRNLDWVSVGRSTPRSKEFFFLPGTRRALHCRLSEGGSPLAPPDIGCSGPANRALGRTRALCLL